MIESAEVIFEDKSILVVNKPFGVVVNRADTVRVETLQDWIEKNEYFSDIDSHREHESFASFKARSGVVHRLDKDTSGVMVIAKTPQAFVELTRQFAERVVTKQYLALLHGKLKPESGSISLPLARSKAFREKFSVSVHGRVARTSWKVERYYSAVLKRGVITKGYQGFSLVKVFPYTGRTHQIRVHFSHLKHPIAGDERYTGKKRAREDKKWCRRQFLHALSLSFLHPKTGKKINFKAELANDLLKVMKYLRE